jgi:LytR cell envelope-related transcriptional attenuator
VIDQVLGVDSTTDTMTGQPLPPPASISISVMNGSGTAEQATDTGAALSALGFHTVSLGDVAPTGDVAETVVYYGSLAPTTVAAAEAVANSMTGSVIMGYDPSEVTPGAEVTVVTGSQFAVNAPPATGGTGSAAGTGATGSAAGTGTTGDTGASSTNTSASDPAIAAPSAANTKLEPWDPRACPAGAAVTAPVPNQL